MIIHYLTNNLTENKVSGSYWSTESKQVIILVWMRRKSLQRTKNARIHAVGSATDLRARFPIPRNGGSERPGCTPSPVRPCLDDWHVEIEGTGRDSRPAIGSSPRFGSTTSCSQAQLERRHRDDELFGCFVIPADVDEVQCRVTYASTVSTAPRHRGWGRRRQGPEAPYKGRATSSQERTPLRMASQVLRRPPSEGGASGQGAGLV
jgi:hypothetical protein